MSFQPTQYEKTRHEGKRASDLELIRKETILTAPGSSTRRANVSTVLCVCFALTFSSSAAPLAFPNDDAGERRDIRPEDYYALRHVGNPRISPDGNWVAYTVYSKSTYGTFTSYISMVPFDGGESIPLVKVEGWAGNPNWSPDGKYLAFESSPDSDSNQVWLRPTNGDEEFRLTEYDEGVSDYVWSPDGSRLAIVIPGKEWPDSASATEEETTTYTGERVSLSYREADVSTVIARFQEISGLDFVVDGDVDAKITLIMADTPWDEILEAMLKAHDLGYVIRGQEDTPIVRIGRLSTLATEEYRKPIVIDHLEFREEGVGYIDTQTEHIHVFDVEKRQDIQITNGPYFDTNPAWSPDGETILFTRIESPGNGKGYNGDIFAASSRYEGTSTAFLATQRNEGAPSFSRDGKLLAFFVETNPDERPFSDNHLAVVPVLGGTEVQLARSLDRDIDSYSLSPEGQYIYFSFENSGSRPLARIPVTGGPIARIVDGDLHVQDYYLGREGRLALLASTPSRPYEVFSYVDGELNRLTKENDEFLEGVKLGQVQRFQTSPDTGSPVEWFLTLPTDPVKKELLPTILWIHGGPASQHSTSFNLEWQLLASAGPSSVYGRDFVVGPTIVVYL